MDTIYLPVTFTFISLYAISLPILSGWVGLYRGKVNILRSYGNDPILFKRIRIYGNLIEVAPAFALMLAVAEFLGLTQNWLWMAVGAFLVGRFLHYLLFDNKIRGAAMGLTLFPAAILGIWSLLKIWVL